MNQLDKQIFTPEGIELRKQNEAKKEVKHIGQLKIHKGQKLYELNLETIDIVPVAFKESAVNLNGSVSIKHVIKDNHWYAVAINTRNAERKFLQMLKNLNHDSSNTTTSAGS